MACMKHQLIKAARMHAEGELERAKTNIMVYMDQSVGIGEHSDIMDAIEKELEEMSKYHDLLEILSTYFPDDYNGDGVKQLLKDSAI